MCDFKSPGVGNDFEHKLHLCGFSCKIKKENDNKNKICAIYNKIALN